MTKAREIEGALDGRLVSRASGPMSFAAGSAARWCSSTGSRNRAGQLYGIGLIERLLSPLYRPGGRSRRRRAVDRQKKTSSCRLRRDHGHACWPRRHGGEEVIRPEADRGASAARRTKGRCDACCSTWRPAPSAATKAVADQVSLGTGLAFADRYRDNKKICFTYFGDGAANQGQVYESFNMAELWRLPVVYLIENNQYAMGTSIERSSATIWKAVRQQTPTTPSRHRGRSTKSWTWLAVRTSKKAAEHARWARGRGRILVDENLWQLSRPLDELVGKIPAPRRRSTW